MGVCKHALVRTEAHTLIVAYTFDLQENTLKTNTIPNPSAGRKHVFRVLRLQDMSDELVTMRKSS